MLWLSVSTSAAHPTALLVSSCVQCVANNYEQLEDIYVTLQGFNYMDWMIIHTVVILSVYFLFLSSSLLCVLLCK